MSGGRLVLRRMRTLLSCLALLTALLCAAPAVAFAYIGPGAGLSAIGTVVAFFGAIFLAVIGFVWYPIKRLLAKYRAARKPENPS